MQKSRYVSLAAIAFAGLPLAVLGEGTTCGQPSVIIPDGRIVDSTIPNGATFIWLFDSVSGRQYTVEVKNLLGTFSSTAFPSSFRISNANAACTTAITTRDTDTIEPLIPGVNGTRHSFLAASSRHWIEFTNTTGADVEYSISVSDTTLFSPAWSTNGAFNTFYSFLNTTNATCNADLTLRDTAGAVTTTAALVIPSGATGNTNTLAMATTRNKTGTATLTHDCPPGAILAETAVANFAITPTPYIQIVKFQPMRESTH